QGHQRGGLSRPRQDLGEHHPAVARVLLGPAALRLRSARGPPSARGGRLPAGLRRGRSLQRVVRGLRHRGAGGERPEGGGHPAPAAPAGARRVPQAVRGQEPAPRDPRRLRRARHRGHPPRAVRDQRRALHLHERAGGRRALPEPGQRGQPAGPPGDPGEDAADHPRPRALRPGPGVRVPGEHRAAPRGRQSQRAAPESLHRSLRGAEAPRAMSTTTPMTKRQRVMAALQGRPVDRLPLAFWLHNFATENSARGLADETRRLARTFDWDFLKPQSRAQCFAEMWGLTYAPSGEKARPYTVTYAPVGSADDLARLPAVDPREGALGEQLEALRLIRGAVGPDVPIIWTVFAPPMILPMLARGGRDQAMSFLRAAPREAARAFDVMAETLAEYARLCLAAGADGLFYATNVATRALMTAEECRRWQRPWDLRILKAVEAAPFNLLHVCGAGIQLEEFADYPVTAFSFATVPGNPTLTEARARTGRAVVGGLPAKPEIAGMTEAALVDRARAATREMDRGLLLGPDCSINPDTPERLLHAVGQVVR